MKKTLVALAAVAATSAFAQSSVTLYGLFDVSYGVTKTSATAWGTQPTRKTTGLQEGTTAGNRLGFRGTEDLGGGMKAGFVAEVSMSMITPNTFNNRLAFSGHADTAQSGGTGAAYVGNNAYASNGSSQNRQSYVSLSGGFGELRAGYHYTNAYTVSSLSGYLGGFEGMSGSDVAHTFGIVGGTRASGLTYLSPKFSGFDVVVQYGSTTNPAIEVDAGFGASASKQQRTGVLVNYGNGPFKASVAHTRLKGLTTTPQLTQVGASYDFGFMSVRGTYNDGDNDAGTDVKSYQVGVTVPFGALKVFGTLGKSEYSNVQTNISCFNGGSTCYVKDIKQQQLGVTYDLSKRTMLYAATGRTKSDTNGSSYWGMKGTDTRVGVRHSF